MNQTVKKLFVVDDDELANEALTSKLKNLGYEVSSATSSGEGAKLFEEGEPDLLIVDYLLSGQNGISLVENLKDKYPHIAGRTLLMTSLDNEAYLPKALETGIKYHIKKTSGNIDLVLEMIKNILKEEK